MHDNLKKLHIKHSKVDTLSVPTLSGFEMVNLNDILYLEADNSYTTFHLANEKPFVSAKSIGFYEEELEEDPFLRVHKSFIVNLNKIKSYIKADNGYIILTNGQPVRVSKSRKEELLVFFKMRRIQNSVRER